jgi:ribose 5-phosphate isomerase B
MDSVAALKQFGFTTERVVAGSQESDRTATETELKKMKVGIAADHGGYEMKEKIYILLGANGHQVVDFGNLVYDNDDDYPDFAISLARAVAAGVVERGVLLCGSGIGASIAANKIDGVRAAVCHDDFSARQGVEDDHMNILCLGGRTTGIAVAWDCVKSFLAAKFSRAERHLRRLAKVSATRTTSIIIAGMPPVPIIGEASVLPINDQAK